MAAGRNVAGSSYAIDVPEVILRI